MWKTEFSVRRLAGGVGQIRSEGQNKKALIAGLALIVAVVFAEYVWSMSAVELAVREVKKLSPREARELLGWLNARRANETLARRRSRTSGRKMKVRQSMKKLKAWQNSIRFTTDWEPPRMPDA